MNKIKYLAILLAICVSTSYAQPLETLLQEAVNNNPQLQAMQLQYEAALERGKQVNELPYPQLGVGVPALRPETRLGGQLLMVSASQLFPWFGTLKAKEDVAIAMAKPQYELIAARRLDLFYQIKNAYYQLYLVDEKKAILLRNMRIYETIERVALAKVKSGKASAADVLRITIKLQEMKQKLAFLENEKAPHIAKINEAANRSFSDTINVELALSEVATIQYDLEAYKKKIAEFHPLISKLNAQVAASKKEQALNEIAGKPSFGVGLDYSMVTPRKDATPTHNGRDILIPKVSMSFPIFSNKFAAKNQEEALKQQAVVYEKEAIVNKMLALLESYQAEYKNALLTIELSEIQAKTARATYDILLGEYSSKGSRFDELLLLQNDLILYELATIKARVQTYLTKAKIDRLTDF